MCHDTWATCPSESGRRCRTSSKTVSLEKICAVTHTLEMMHEGILQISALCVNNQMSYYTKMSRKQEKNNFAPHDIYSYSDTADLSSVLIDYQI